MTSRGDIQRQLAQLMGTIRAEGHKLEDGLPEEMQYHFQDMIALKDAREYIKDLEARENDLQDKVATHLSELQAKQDEIDNMPTEHKSALVDLEQAEGRARFYQHLLEDAVNRAERYQRDLVEALQAQAVANQDSIKMSRLEREVADREAAILKLVDENRKMADLQELEREQHCATLEEQALVHSAQREQDHKAIDELRSELDSAHTLIHELEDENIQAVELSDGVTAGYDSILSVLEGESGDVTAALNRHSTALLIQQHDNDLFYSAISTEFGPVTGFYQHAVALLHEFEAVFKSIADPEVSVLPSFPSSLDTQLKAAHEQLNTFDIAFNALDTEGLPQGKVKGQVQGVITSGRTMYKSLTNMRGDITAFVERLRSRPDVWLAIKGRAEKRRLSSSSSSTRSVLSFESIAQRLSGRYQQS